MTNTKSIKKKLAKESPVKCDLMAFCLSCEGITSFSKLIHILGLSSRLSPSVILVPCREEQGIQILSGFAAFWGGTEGKQAKIFPTEGNPGLVGLFAFRPAVYPDTNLGLLLH